MIAVDDLRSRAGPAFAPFVQAGRGIQSLYGASAPFGSPAFAHRDAADITAAATPEPHEAIPGWLQQGSLWEDQRYVLRVPRAWNGRLVVAGCPGQRTEFASDRLFGDPILARGYAYIAGNKGNGEGAAIVDASAALRAGGATLPRFPLPDGRGVSFWQHAPGHTVERWRDELVALAALGQQALHERFGTAPAYVYAAGLSNGGYQVRRAIETSDAFDGALTWNAVLWRERGNVADSLAAAIAAMAAGEPERLVEIGFPPDVQARSGASSLYRRNLQAYWWITLWLHAAQLDPEMSLAYGDVRDPHAAEAWAPRIAQWRYDRTPAIAQRVAGFANDGRIRCKTIDLASEFDHLIPPRIHFEPYRALVEAAGAGSLYRGRVIPFAQHVDAWCGDPEYPSLRPGHPAVMAAWDELVAWVEDVRG